MMQKKGQGLSLDVIIIAALALIVLVVLVVVFMGRSAVTEKGISKQGNAELVQYKALSYGDCHPGSGAEEAFVAATNQATTADERDQAKADFESVIDSCKSSASTKEQCGSSAGCRWK